MGLCTLSLSLHSFSLSALFLSLCTLSLSLHSFSLSALFLSLCTLSLSLHSFSLSTLSLSLCTLPSLLLLLLLLPFLLSLPFSTVGSCIHTKYIYINREREREIKTLHYTQPCVFRGRET